MDREQYLASPAVRSFSDWLGQRLDSPGSFVHSYVSRRDRTTWECRCLYSAFLGYRWPFRMRDPLTGRTIHGSTFDETVLALESVGKGLEQALRAGDHTQALSCCNAVLDWGGIVTGRYLERIGEGLVPQLRRWVRQLNDPGLRLDSLPRVEMNSGWTKIYSLLVPGFTMYDSRVAAALALLAATFAQEQGLREVPSELRFALVPDRSTVQRRPIAFRDEFPVARPGDGHHLRSNIMANWLLGEVVTAHNSRFGELPRSHGLWALQSALFMIGYETAPADSTEGVQKASTSTRTTTGSLRRSSLRGSGQAQFKPSFVVMPLSGRGTPVAVTRTDMGFHVVWGNLAFYVEQQLVREILEEFLVDKNSWYPLGASMTNPPPDGLGSFLAKRAPGLTPRHASAIAPLLRHEGLVESRGVKAIELRRRDVG